MNIVGVIMFAVVCAWAVVAAVVAATDRGQRWRLAQLETRLGRLVPPELEAVVRHRVAARLGWGSLGVVLGAGTGTVVGAVSGVAGSVSAVVPLFGGALVGWTLAVCLVAFREARRPLPARSRVARARDTALLDYLPALQLWSGLAAVVLSFAGLLVVLALDHGSSRQDAAVSVHLVLLAVPVVTLAAAGVAAALASAVLHAPQPASSSEELAWDDVLRWRTLGDLVDLPVGAAYVMVVTALAILGSPRGGSSKIAVAMMLVTQILVLVHVQITVRTRPEPRLRRRLWAHDLEEVAGADR